MALETVFVAALFFAHFAIPFEAAKASLAEVWPGKLKNFARALESTPGTFFFGITAV